MNNCTHIQITKNLRLYCVDVERPVEQKQSEQVQANNHIWVIDRSGSMSGVLRNLIEDVKSKIDTLQVGDTVSIGWFSGPGEFDFAVKGYTIQKDNSRVKRVVDNLSFVKSTTCFSEILTKVEDVINDLKPLNNTFSLVFFTDGHPVVPDYDKEIESINKALLKINSKLSSALVVGYSNYYNKELLAQIAAKLGGTLIHSSNLPEYSQSMTEFIEEVSQFAGKVNVKIPSEIADYDNSPAYAVFSIRNKAVVTYSGAQFDYAIPRKDKSCYYVIAKANGEPDTDPLREGSSNLRAAYAAALVLTQKTKTAAALEILGAIGDVALIDAVTNAFTNDEYGKVESKIRKAIRSPEGRYTKGKHTGYLPKEDAFCVIDAIDAITSDNDARIVLNSDFKYNRIGVKTEQKDGTPTFERDENVQVKVETLTWNSSFLNLSLTTKIPGKVTVGDDHEKYGFAKKIPTYVWRSYSIIKDGNCNVEILPMVLGERCFNTLRNNRLIDDSVCWEPGKVVNVNLGAVPVMNRMICKGFTSAKNLCKLLITELELEFTQKALNSMLKAAGGTETGRVYSEEATAYLEKYCIGKNGFSPECKAQEPVDHYTAKEFVIKIKSFSGIPSIADVEKKKKAIAEAEGKAKGKKPKLTPAEALMEMTLHKINSSVISAIDKNKAIERLAADTKLSLKQVRTQIQKIKFAVLLGKSWFDEFTSREDCGIDFDGYSFTFSVRNVEVPF